MPRLNFTARIKREAYARSKGICECNLIPWLKRPKGCGMKLGIGNTFFEHINPDAIRPDNSLENCVCLVKICWKEKTYSYDLRIIAKTRRVRDKARGIRNPPTIRGWRKFNGEIVYADRRR